MTLSPLLPFPSIVFPTRTFFYKGTLYLFPLHIHAWWCPLVLLSLLPILARRFLLSMPPINALAARTQPLYNLFVPKSSWFCLTKRLPTTCMCATNVQTANGRRPSYLMMIPPLTTSRKFLKETPNLSNLLTTFRRYHPFPPPHHHHRRHCLTQNHLPQSPHNPTYLLESFNA